MGMRDALAVVLDGLGAKGEGIAKRADHALGVAVAQA
jgi:hypothetical protein